MPPRKPPRFSLLSDKIASKVGEGVLCPSFDCARKPSDWGWVGWEMGGVRVGVIYKCGYLLSRQRLCLKCKPS